MKINVNLATTLQLNYLVAVITNVPSIQIVYKPEKVCIYGEVSGIDFPYQPATDWSQGGPIIEREKICVICPSTGDFWDARFHSIPPKYIRGETPLIAAMRCYVASKLGDEVDVPDELCVTAKEKSNG